MYKSQQFLVKISQRLYFSAFVLLSRNCQCKSIPNFLNSCANSSNFCGERNGAESAVFIESAERYIGLTTRLLSRRCAIKIQSTLENFVASRSLMRDKRTNQLTTRQGTRACTRQVAKMKTMCKISRRKYAVVVHLSLCKM